MLYIFWNCLYILQIFGTPEKNSRSAIGFRFKTIYTLAVPTNDEIGFILRKITWATMFFTHKPLPRRKSSLDPLEPRHKIMPDKDQKMGVGFINFHVFLLCTTQLVWTPTRLYVLLIVYPYYCKIILVNKKKFFWDRGYFRKLWVCIHNQTKICHKYSTNYIKHKVLKTKLVE